MTVPGSSPEITSVWVSPAVASSSVPPTVMPSDAPVREMVNSTSTDSDGAMPPEPG